MVGGGSIADGVPIILEVTIGSGNDGMASSADEVSIVICVVRVVLERCV